MQEQSHTALIAIKILHTVVWALLGGCVVAIPIASWFDRHRFAAGLSAVVAVEILLLAVNRGRCPLTSVAARYTDYRRADFDIYLPLWLAKHNKLIFGTLYFAGIFFALARWARAPN